MKGRLGRVIALCVAVLALGIPAATLAVEPEPGPFDRTWARTDLAVEHGRADRTWMWGPEANTFTQFEPYAEAPDGQRLVQYFDKSRMELNDPEGDPNSPWHVTNGLLVKEMVTGRVQIGDDEYEQREPAAINVAGDPDDPIGPTYAAFASVLDADPLRVAADGEEPVTITWTIDRLGNVHQSQEMAGYGVTTRFFDDVTNHTIAQPFWDFMKSEGTVFEIGEFFDDALFENPFYATGRPITEAYWSRVAVGGEQRDVLIQCFERRCLTYTPDNPDGWKVEAGNVGRHYYTWRYSDESGRIAYSYQGDIWVMQGDGGEPSRITSGDVFDSKPLWSPDGSRLLYMRTVASDAKDDTHFELRVVNADGSNDQKLADLGSYKAGSGLMPSFDWSPDSKRVAFSAASKDATIDVIDADGTGHVTLTGSLGGTSHDLDWSPVDDRIVFKHDHTPDGQVVPETGLYVVEPYGRDLEQLTEAGTQDNDPQWSPDGTRITFVRGGNIDTRDLYVMEADGSDARRFVRIDGAGSPSWSPDGSRIAFVAQSKLWVADADGEDPQRLAEDISVAQGLAWSTDEPTRIIFTAFGELGGLGTVDVASEDVHVLFSDGGRSPAWGR